MLLQSNHGYVEIFPAIPVSWNNVSFNKLRAQGAFLISAKKENGVIGEVKVFSEKGGLFRLKLPFKIFFITNISKKYSYNRTTGILEINMNRGERIVVRNGYE